MTALDQFDPFRQRVTAAIDEIAAARRPDYLDAILQQTARTPQRPRWAFPGRWFPIGATIETGRVGRAPLRPILLLALLALAALAATSVLIAGSRPTLPLPVGPARNGAIVFERDGTIYRAASIGDPAAAIIDGPQPVAAPYLSPDGTTMMFVRTTPDGDYLMVAGSDGSEPREVLGLPIQEGWAQAWWAYDSSYVLITGQFDNGTRRLFKVPADGSGAQEIVLPVGLVPYDALPSPADPDVFLLRALTSSRRSQGLYLAHLDGTVGARFDLPGVSAFGIEYTLSGAQWSPDGSTIAYNAITVDPVTLTTSFRVHLLNGDGTGDRPLPAPSDARVHQGWPTWSPDGTQLMVERFVLASDGERDASSWVAIIPADGSSPGRDLSPRSDRSAGTGTVKLWSPDGASGLLFFSDLAQTYLVDTASGQGSAVQLGDNLPDWQRRAP